MNEFLDEQPVKTRVIDATEVNAMHALELERASKERRMRSKEQSKSEILGNDNIDYQKHMPWIDE